MHEYAFDVKLFAVVRVKAPTKEAAIAALKDVIDCAELPLFAEQHGVVVTEASLSVDTTEAFEPFEVDGRTPVD
jgi:hypothetical protein